MLTPAELVAFSPFLRHLGHGSTVLAPPPPPEPSPNFRYLLSFVGSVRLKNRGYSFGVRQAVYRQVDGATQT